MNRIKAAIAVLAIVLTAGVTFASQKNTNFVDCYNASNQLIQSTSCGTPSTAFCCSTLQDGGGTVFTKVP